MTDEILVKMAHVRQAGMCSKGAREFFKRHSLDWQEFLKTGIEAAKLEATGDAMAIEVVRVAKNGR
jgi:hypothetical protein